MPFSTRFIRAVDAIAIQLRRLDAGHESTPHVFDTFRHIEPLDPRSPRLGEQAQLHARGIASERAKLVPSRSGTHVAPSGELAPGSMVYDTSRSCSVLVRRRISQVARDRHLTTDKTK